MKKINQNTGANNKQTFPYKMHIYVSNQMSVSYTCKLHFVVVTMRCIDQFFLQTIEQSNRNECVEYAICPTLSKSLCQKHI